jgi:acyl-CoA synthetase (NDP forming)
MMERAVSHSGALSEARSKAILRSYGVPVVEEAVASGVEEAVAAAEQFGWPVVLKGLGAELVHKTELGLVRLHLHDAQAMRIAATELAAAGGDRLEGFLVQPQLEGRREFVAGLFRDPLFGPIVLFGLGGVFTEALNDVVLRLAPLSDADVEDMLEQLRSAVLLGAFRGEAAVDRHGLYAALLGLSKLGMDRPEVAEVDLNPLLVAPSGEVRAVDALVVQRAVGPQSSPRPAVSPEELGSLFHPRSVAFIGASAGLGKWGQSLPANLIAGGFEGAIYLINPRGGTQWGRPVYRGLAEVTGTVDLAVVTIPAAGVPELLPQLKAKAVRHLLLISSGFSEVGDAGRDLELQVLAAARDAGVVVLGPNTMGICNPHHKLYLTGVHARPQPGPTSLVSQSGNMGVQLLDFAARQGLGIRAFAGSGNEAMVAVEDFLDAFAVDVHTRTVLLYLESVKDGRRFFEAARRTGRKKPVILLKGGRSAEGNRAAASHTGALAADHRVFDAACAQAGVLSVRQPVEMLDAAAVFSSLPLPRGRRVAIMTLGGGWGVVTSDLCAERGLLLPALDDAVKNTLDALLPPYWSRANPVDLVGERDPELPFRGLEELMAWDGCDAVIHLGIFGRRFLLASLLESTAVADPTLSAAKRDQLQDQVDRSEQQYVEHVVRLMECYGKPAIGVDLATGDTPRTLYELPGAEFKGVFFPSPERAVRALAHMCDYRDFLTRSGEAV